MNIFDGVDGVFPPDLESHRSGYAGLPLGEAYGPGTEQPPPGEAAWVVRGYGYGYGPDGRFESRFAHFTEHVDTTRVRALVVGEWEDAYEKSADHVVAALAGKAAAFPELRALFLGDMPSERCEISWIRQADVTPLLEAFPRLERLEVRGGSGLRLRPVRHEALKVLRFESGGLPAEVVRAVGASEFPALEHLELWLGVSDYGGDATVADLEGVLSGERLPALRRLGLQDSEIQDEIAAAVAAAPVVARLEALALSMGTLTDEGAEALLSGQPLTHLALLDLHHHYLSDAMAERIRRALPGVTVDLSEKEEPDEEWRYVAVAE
ncbi:STM4015 family protein [Planomonospora alba]|uniref:STM4015 family protein n=1 Tax=Planomonospora alba TaxID=161354 RepID=A0ABP6N7U4_9ACTN